MNNLKFLTIFRLAAHLRICKLLSQRSPYLPCKYIHTHIHTYKHRCGHLRWVCVLIWYAMFKNTSVSISSATKQWESHHIKMYSNTSMYVVISIIEKSLCMQWSCLLVFCFFLDFFRPFSAHKCWKVCNSIFLLSKAVKYYSDHSTYLYYIYPAV